MRRPMGTALLGLALALLASAAHAQVSFPDKPPRSDYFVDRAGLLTPADATEVNRIAGALLKEEAIPLFVVTIPSLASFGASSLGIEGYAQALFDHWGIGFQERNYGILLLVSVGDRKARIEYGRDWNNRYNREAEDIMWNLIVPAFKRDDYSTGILDGVRGLDAVARGLQLPRPTAPWWFFPVLIGGFVLVIAVIVNLFKTGRSGWGWALIVVLGTILVFIISALASSRGSGGGFGGGSSGGGGATGSW